MPAALHQRTRLPTLRIGGQGDVLEAILVARQHIGKVPQAPRIDAVGLGQRPQRLGKVAGLTRVQASHPEARLVKRAHLATLVAACGLQNDQIDYRP